MLCCLLFVLHLREEMSLVDRFGDLPDGEMLDTMIREYKAPAHMCTCAHGPGN